MINNVNFSFIQKVVIIFNPFTGTSPLRICAGEEKCHKKVGSCVINLLTSVAHVFEGQFIVQFSFQLS